MNFVCSTHLFCSQALPSALIFLIPLHSMVNIESSQLIDHAYTFDEYLHPDVKSLSIKYPSFS